jgi:phosphoenolpyruvate-protein phosphotransferase
MAHTILIGRAGSPGVGIGRLLVVGPPSPTAGAGHADGHVGGNGRGPGGATSEHARLAAALDRCAIELEALAVQTAARAGEEVGAIFEAQALFARDPGIVGPAFTLIAAGAGAGEAILQATSEQADVLAAVDDDYSRERAADVRDVGRRVAAILTGEARPDLWHADGAPAVIVAADLDPSAVATLRPELVAGIALAGGTPTGHAAIVARALGIPLVLGLGASLTGVAVDVAGVDGAVDGTAGRLLIEPSAADLAELEAVMAAASSGSIAALRTGPTGSAGPHGVSVVANVASPLEAEAALRAGAEGIGLVRTELLFLGRSTPPAVGEQRATYARILEVMGDPPVVFRTLDVGGDKPAEWQSATVESNPALGVRGLRLGLRRPDLLDDQFAALLEAAAGRELRVMLPMVSTREEVEAARERLDAVRARLVSEGAAVASAVQLGVMIEVASAAIMADALAEVADFFSIGTNDLVQYVLAADRTNPELADLASALQPAVLRLIDVVVRAGHGHGRHVAVCGEAAADPAVIPFLVGLGVTELSVSPGSVAAVRSLVGELDLVRCRGLATRALAAGSLAEVAELAAETAQAAEAPAPIVDATA